MDTLTKLLKRLYDGQVEFSLIGGLAGVHYGVSLVTDAADVCARFSVENLRRIESCLKDLNPVHRLTANRVPLELTDELCGRLKSLYLKTDLGVLDCLSEVAGVGNFDAVMENSQLMQFPFGKCYILKIDALIKAKQAVGRPHDLIAVRELEAIRELKRSDKSSN